MQCQASRPIELATKQIHIPAPWSTWGCVETDDLNFSSTGMKGDLEHHLLVWYGMCSCVLQLRLIFLIFGFGSLIFVNVSTGDGTSERHAAVAGSDFNHDLLLMLSRGPIEVKNVFPFALVVFENDKAVLCSFSCACSLPQPVYYAHLGAFRARKYRNKHQDAFIRAPGLWLL